MKYRSIFIIITIVIANYCNGQTIFQSLTGAELRDSLVANYKPSNVLSYDNARDSLFAVVYNVDDSVTCVYTDWKIHIEPESPVAPRTQAHDKGLNTEHTYPQSKGAGGGNARSDLHHLFPTRADANSSRGNLPFNEVPEDGVQRWWRLDYSTTTTPTELIEEYSRRGTSSFQVRDDHKGNAARSVFYFYTMYQNEAQAADPNFFAIQQTDLLLWHQQDPVDSIETARTHKIASYQDERVNPFIMDTTLIRRAFGIDVPKSFSGVSAGDTQVNLSWERNLSSDSVMIVWNQTGQFTDPVDGQQYNDGDDALGGTIMLPLQDNHHHHTDLSVGTYHYRIFSINDDNGSPRYSVGKTQAVTTGEPLTIHYWGFNDPPGDDWGFDDIEADIGIGILTHNFGTAPQSFSGTTVNALDTYPAGLSFAPQGGSEVQNNGKHLQLQISTTGYEDIMLSYAAQRTSTGFTSHTISYSLDGTFDDEEEIDVITNIPDSWGTVNVPLQSISSLSNNESVWIRITLDGATHTSGNNRIDNLKITGNPITTNVWNDDSKPTEFKLYNNYPNPFNPSTTVRYKIPQTVDVTLSIYNVLGQRVATLVDERQNPDHYEVIFLARDLPSGTYISRFTAGEYTAVKKLLLVK